MNRSKLCGENCNSCSLLMDSNSKMLSHILNEAEQRFGNDFYSIVQSHCPNLTVCTNCSIDDFCHDEDCLLIHREGYDPHEEA